MINVNDLINATIIIPTKNRPEFVERLLRYYSSVEKKCTILIADGSDEGYHERMVGIISQYSTDLTIDYLHKSVLDTAEEEDSVREIDSRILKSIERVKTPYIALSGDDDFFIPESIERGIIFLENNPSFELYHGQAIYFMVKNNGPYGSIEQIGEYSQYSIINESAKDRCISFQLFNYASIWHSVFRTRTLKNSYITTHAQKLDITFFEPFFSTLMIMQGKVFCDSSLSLVRQGWVRKDFDDTMLHNYVIWLSNSGWINLYDHFINGLTEELAKIEGTENIEDLKVFFRKLFWCNISKDLHLHCGNYREGMKSLIGNNLSTHRTTCKKDMILIKSKKH